MKNSLSLELDIQIATHETNLPDTADFEQWIQTLLKNEDIKAAEIAIRIVDENESASLNRSYRLKEGPTNVLAFPLRNPIAEKKKILGDLVICAPLVKKEANQQGKKLLAHWAHLTIHGVLHLLGYDHIKAHEAEVMESKEVELLSKIGFDNPYH